MDDVASPFRLASSLRSSDAFTPSNRRLPLSVSRDPVTARDAKNRRFSTNATLAHVILKL